MKKLILLFLFLSPTIYAANDLDNWNGNVSKEVREKLNNDTTTYKTLSSVKATAEQSSSKYTDTVTRAGSKVGVTIDALKVPASKTDIAKAYLARHKGAIKNLAKGGAYTFVGSAALGALIKGIGWVMDEGGKITKTNTYSYDHPSNQYYYNSYANKIDQYGSTPLEAAQNYCNQIGGTFDYWSAINTVAFCKNPRLSVQIYRVNNPNYNPSSTTPEPTQTISDSQFQQAIQDQLTNAPNSDLSNQLATDAYTLQDSSGKATDSLAKADTTSGINDAAKTIVDAAKSAIANDANPQNAKLTSGSSGKAETETETKNEDGTAGEPSKSSTNFELPAFCDWASAVCEWFDWTKETPDDTTETDQPDIDDQGIFTRKFDTVFSLSKDCPADIPFNLDTQYLKVSNTISLKWLCIIFTALGYPLVFASNCIGIWILYEAVIRRQKAG
ncbi:hypothetical protein PX668_01430 [Acinetobacter soli]|nr:hypothetical protein [Acinetobacter soli]WEI14003.1 hypothetical protein PX667_08575 [Acinetobacter soli]WEI15667.1 hypothetical protein PX668_01430 [Acinetobacter soli]